MEQSLASLEALIANKNPMLHASLRRGAAEKALTVAAKDLGHALPDDVAGWFRWHDGTKEAISFGPEDNWYALPLAEALDTWRFLGDPSEEIQQPFKKQWLPFMANGAGDHLCVDLDSGKIVTYYHEERMRPTAAPSLAAWIAARAKEYAATPGPNTELAFDGTGMVWSPRAKPPTEEETDAAPPGTVYRRRSAGSDDMLLMVKLDDDAWYAGTGNDVETALADAREGSKKPRNYGNRTGGTSMVERVSGWFDVTVRAELRVKYGEPGKVPSAARLPATPLGRSLRDLEALLTERAPELLTALRPPATAKSVEALVAAVGPVHDEVRAWFAWHDGAAEAALHGLPESSGELLSIDAALEARSTLLRKRKLAHWRPTLLPLFSASRSHGESLVCVDVVSGAVFAWTQHLRRLEASAPSLAAWVAAWGKALAEARFLLPRPIFAGKLRWAEVPRPLDVNTLKAASVGAVIGRRAYQDKDYIKVYWVKLGPGCWLKKYGDNWLDEINAAAKQPIEEIYGRQDEAGVLAADASGAYALTKWTVDESRCR